MCSGKYAVEKNAVIFGAGNIGRGFIGQLFCESGYAVTFVDIDEALIAALNRDGSYRLQTVFNDDVEESVIGPVRAVNGNDAEAVEAAVASADLGATAVGAGALKFIAPRVAGGILRRNRRQAESLNFIICENLKGAAAVFTELVLANVDPRQRASLSGRIGFVDTVIGRMVPIPTPAMRAADVSLIRVEPYKELPVDRTGFVGAVPAIVGMVPQSNFPLFTARKLYIHNCGHALLAYSGYLRGHTYGYEALADPDIRRVVDGGLRESITGVVAAYNADRGWLEEHVEELMTRFANRALGDTVFRLGRDPQRKLAPTDRLVGPANLCVRSGTTPTYLAWAIACALRFDPADDPAALELQTRIGKLGAAAVLTEVTGIDAGSALGRRILTYHGQLGVSPKPNGPA